MCWYVSVTNFAADEVADLNNFIYCRVASPVIIHHTLFSIYHQNSQSSY